MAIRYYQLCYKYNLTTIYCIPRQAGYIISHCKEGAKLANSSTKKIIPNELSTSSAQPKKQVYKFGKV